MEGIGDLVAVVNGEVMPKCCGGAWAQQLPPPLGVEARRGHEAPVEKLLGIPCQGLWKPELLGNTNLGGDGNSC